MGKSNLFFHVSHKLASEFLLVPTTLLTHIYIERGKSLNEMNSQNQNLEKNEERAITKVFWGGAQSVPVVAFIPIAHSIRVHKKPILPCLQLLFPSLGLLLRRSLQP